MRFMVLNIELINEWIETIFAFLLYFMVNMIINSIKIEYY